MTKFQSGTCTTTDSDRESLHTHSIIYQCSHHILVRELQANNSFLTFRFCWILVQNEPCAIKIPYGKQLDWLRN